MEPRRRPRPSFVITVAVATASLGTGALGAACGGQVDEQVDRSCPKASPSEGGACAGTLYCRDRKSVV